jgi:hypothetical protein
MYPYRRGGWLDELGRAAYLSKEVLKRKMPHGSGKVMRRGGIDRDSAWDLDHSQTTLNFVDRGC